MIRRKSSLALAAVAAFALAGASTAFSATDPFFQETGTDPIFNEQIVGYFADVGNNAGPQVNVVSPAEGIGLSEFGFDPDTICAMMYVFDTAQILEECCGCPVTSDSLQTFNVAGDLASDPAFLPFKGPGGSTLQAGLVRVVAAEPDGCFQPSIFEGICLTGNLVLDGLEYVCDATGGTYPAGQYNGENPISGLPYPFSLGSKSFVGQGEAFLLLPDTEFGVPLRAWGTNVNVGSLTEIEYQDNPITQNDANSLAEVCGDIQQARSGKSGVCSCGTGNDLIP